MSDEKRVVPLFSDAPIVDRDVDEKDKIESDFLAAVHTALADGAVRGVILYMTQQNLPGCAPTAGVADDAILGMCQIMIEEILGDYGKDG